MKRIKILGAITIIVALMSLSGAYAQTRLPGVSVGDTFKYSYAFDMNSSGEQSESILPEFLQALINQTKNIDSAQVTITGVSGSTVTAQTVLQFKNGTQETNTGTLDVSTGSGNITLSLIAANLTSNDYLYSDSSSGKINETITQTNALGTREVNHQNVIMSYYVTQDELAGFGISGPLNQTNSQNTYWDRQTGLLVKMSYVMHTESEQINADIMVDVVLLDSNVRAVPEFPVTMLLLVILGISTLAFLKLRHTANRTFNHF